MKRVYYVMAALLFSVASVSVSAQVRIGNNTEPHKGAVLDLQSTETANKGVLLPQVKLTELNKFTPVAGTATEGMLVYNTNDGFSEGVGAYVWDGDQWAKTSGTSGTGGSGSIGNGGSGGRTNVGSLTGECGAYVTAVQWKAFMCYNLGATENGYPFSPSAELHGAKYTWGTKTPIVTQAVDQANASAPSGWTTPTAAADGAWLDASKTANDPCPEGWRVPTQSQWAGVVANNKLTTVGNWTSSADNYSSGAFFGDHLFLPAAGFRSNNGAQNNRGISGYYWSSTINGTSTAYNLYFTNGAANPALNYARVRGMPVRCVAE